MSYSSVVLAKTPVAYWKFGEASGTVADNAEGTAALDGAYVNTPTLGVAEPTDDGDTAASFARANSERVLVPDNAALDLGNGPLSYEIWINPADLTTQAWLMAKGTFSPGLHISATTGRITWASIGSGTGCTSGASGASAGSWWHIVGTKSAANVWLLYLNSVDVTTFVGSPTTASTGTGLYIGSSATPDLHFNGAIAKVAVYNYALTPAEVAENYAARSTTSSNKAAIDAGVGAESYLILTTPDESGTGVDSITVAGTPPGPIVLAATSSAVAAATGALTTGFQLQGTTSGASASQASLTTVIQLVGSLAAAAFANASELTGGAAAAALAGSLSALSGVRGVLVVTPPVGLTGSVTYVVEILDSSPTFGPGAKLGELWDLRNLGWSTYDRIPGKAFFTLSQLSDMLALITPLTTHIRIWRLTPRLTTLVFTGAIIDYDAAGDDVVFSAYDYKALLSISRSGYRTMYPTKALGSEIVSPEWALAKGALSSPLGFVATGTIEDPLGTDGVTVIKTNAQFGLLDQMRLQLFFDLSEIGRANTVNHTTFDITRSETPTFEFRKDKGSNVDLGLVLNGNVSEYRHLPNWTSYRNDLATIGTTVGGGATELVVKDDTAAASKGRRQDVFTIKTLLGIAGAATTADQQQAASQRMLKSALELQPTLQLRLLRNSIDFFDGWDLCDKPIVEIANGIDVIAERWRILGARATFDEAGEAPSLIVTPVAN